MTRHDDRELSQQDFGKLVGLTSRSIANLRERGLPCHVEGGRVFVPVAEGMKWYLDFKLAQAERRHRPSSMDEAKKRLEAARAELAELELTERRRDLMRTADHEALLSDAFARVASKLRPLADQVARQVTGKTVGTRKLQATRIVDDIYQQLAAAEDVPRPPPVESSRSPSDGSPLCKLRG